MNKIYVLLLFGMFLIPYAAAEELVFVHMTDVHLCDADFAKSYYGASADADPPAFFGETITEIGSINPDFVVCTGDLVAAADKFGPETAEVWFTLYNDSIQELIDADIPVYEVLGNHDVVGVNNKSVNITEPGYGKEMFESYFGATNYSFDCGGHHFIVLDSNKIDEKWGMNGKGLQYIIDEPQLSWLEDDLISTSNPTIVFLHEPTPTLDNSSDVWEVLNTHNTLAIFSGHWHDDELLNSSGIPEQVGGAVCGGWWRGPNKDGIPQGYRIIVVNGTEMDTFYKATGVDKQINILEPSDPIVNGTVEVMAKIYSDNPVTVISYRVDGGDVMPMAISEEGMWYVAEAMWDTKGLLEGYHTIEVLAADTTENFSKEMQVKVSDDKIASIGEVRSNLDVYTGKYPTIEGTVTAVFYSGKIPVIQDKTGGIPIWAGDIGEDRPTFAIGDVWSIRGQLIEYTDTYELALIEKEDASKLGEAAVPEPELKNASEIDGFTEGLLVVVKDGTVMSKDYNGFTIQDDCGEVYVYGGYAGYDTGAINVGDLVDVIGVGWQYKDIYEVCIRSASDVISHNSSAAAATKLSVNVVPAISITVESSSLDFGTIGAGLSSDALQINIVNTGTHNVNVTAKIGADESGFYEGALRLDCAGVDEFSKAIPANITYFENTEDVAASLEVPDWAGGAYDGTVLFVAEGI
jgi:DNA/RNA endonuclease YhcR with UshA esterase domain/predicted MPP superfamily phosphohydrolase